MAITPENERGWAMFCHLSSLLWIPLAAIGLPIPFASIVLPLVVWAARRRESDFIDHHGRESLNFQLSMLLYGFVLLLIGVVFVFIIAVFFGLEGFNSSDPSTFVGALIGGAVAYVGFLVLWGVLQTVLVAIAGVQAVQGKKSRYPLTIRFIPAGKS